MERRNFKDKEDLTCASTINEPQHEMDQMDSLVQSITSQRLILFVTFPMQQRRVFWALLPLYDVAFDRMSTGWSEVSRQTRAMFQDQGLSIPPRQQSQHLLESQDLLNPSKKTPTLFFQLLQVFFQNKSFISKDPMPRFSLTQALFYFQPRP